MSNPRSIASLKIPALSGAALIAASLLTGCAGLTASNTSTGDTFGGSATISGHIHGGNQPVSNSDVRLYAAGITGYGSAGTLYATTSSGTDSSFSFTKNPALTGPTGGGSTPVYGCPTATDPQMYIIARGGNTQGSGSAANAAAVFIVALGKCSTISAATFVNLNEITSVATMAALQQYFAPANATTSNLNQFGYPNTTQAAAGFANGVATIANLAAVATGTIASATLSGTPAGSTTVASVTATPEIAKINTIADVLQACVNTTSNTSAGCTTLFTNATAPNPAVTSQPALNFGAATDTLQALYYMLTNPTSGSATNISNLFALVPATAPFQPASASAPTDWTIGIRYSSSSACTAGTFLGAAYHLAADAAGNIWIAGGGASGNLMEVSPNGTPLTCALGATVATSHSVNLDVNGNVWIAAGTTSNLYKYVPSSATSTTWTTLNTPYAVAADGSGNVFYTSPTGTLIGKFTSAASATTPTASTQIATVGALPYPFAIDTAGDLFTGNATGSTTASLVYAIYPSTAAGNTGGYLTTSQATNSCNTYGVSVGLVNSIYISNSTYGACANGVGNSTAIDTFASGTLTAGVDSAIYAGGVYGPRENVIDGAGNVWSANANAAVTNYVTSATSGYFAATESSAAGVALSPTGNTAGASDSGGFQKDTTIFPAGLRSLAIDPTGNVWIGLNSASTTSVSISEIVGAAVPVVTPIASALLAGATSTNAVQKP